MRLLFPVVFLLSFLFLLFGDDVLSKIWRGFSLGRGYGEGTATLNGRIPLWTECLRYAGERLYTGHGFSSFWTPKRISEISNSQGWTLGSGHSIYIDILLDLGIVGAALLLLVLLTGVAVAWRRYNRTDDAGFAFCVGVLAFVLFEGIMESQFLMPGYLAFMVMVVLSNLGFAKWRPEATIGVRARPG
jgi:O-antigen ligase